LKSQLAQAATKTSAAGSNAQAGPQLAALQSEANRLRLENETLQNRLKLATTSRADDAARIQQLERERSELQKDKPSERRGILFWRKPSDASDNPDREKELSQQIAALRARIETFEAQAVPYSAEELALIKTQTAPAVSSRASKTQSAKTPPPGTESLAAEAQRSFASRRFEEAERKYLEILRHDINSVYTLANLAAIQLELGRLAEAEKHVKQALAQSPNDSYSLSILGYLKFRQESYDDAVDALSRAAELDPQNPEIQNYLGVALSHKGMRKPAETALRKAVVIEPGYGSAQNNLAVFYATQNPPWIGLARYHYQKALDAGHPRNEELEKILEQKSAAQ
jgi:Flp pilus assembly protein TadD